MGHNTYKDTVVDLPRPDGHSVAYSRLIYWNRHTPDVVDSDGAAPHYPHTKNDIASPQRASEKYTKETKSIFSGPGKIRSQTHQRRCVPDPVLPALQHAFSSSEAIHASS